MFGKYLGFGVTWGDKGIMGISRDGSMRALFKFGGIHLGPMPDNLDPKP